MVFFYLLGTISTGYIFTQFVFNKKKISFRHTGASAIFEKTNFRTATVVILVDFIIGDQVPSENQIIIADFNNDSLIDLFDIMQILQIVLEG